MAGLDHPDDLIRESFFEAFFDVTGVHMCYEPLGPRDERLADIASLQGWWARYGGEESLRGVHHVPGVTQKSVLKIIGKVGDGIPAGIGTAFHMSSFANVENTGTPTYSKHSKPLKLLPTVGSEPRRRGAG